MPKISSARGIDSASAIKALVGEVEGESFQCKLATAEALRNRGSLKGVYGISSKRVLKASPKVWKDCSRAWEASRQTRIVGGATVWMSDADLKKFSKKTPRWFRAYEFVCKIGGHSFFKLKTKKRSLHADQH